MPIRSTLEFTPAAAPVAGLVTKFGGQPNWIAEPQWPLSRATGNPMRFIAQIALEEALFPGASGRMAYLFMTDEEDYVDGTWEPDGGENAVVIQPGKVGAAVAALASGPTLYEMVEVKRKKPLEPQPREYTVRLTRGDDPLFQPESQRAHFSDEEWDAYANALDGNKIGGTPIFLQDDEFPSPGDWRLLLQLDSTRVPFFVNFGDAGVAYAFLSMDGSEGKLLWQCA
jgi:uncharacterized protein YwqG